MLDDAPEVRRLAVIREINRGIAKHNRDTQDCVKEGFGRRPRAHFYIYTYARLKKEERELALPIIQREYAAMGLNVEISVCGINCHVVHVEKSLDGIPYIYSEKQE